MRTHTSIIPKLFILVLFCLLLFLEARATHFMGGEITYECISGNTYKVNLTVYKDCNGGGEFDSLLVINLDAPQCGLESSQTLVINQNYPIIITPLCTQVPDLCEEPGGAFGVEEYLYEGLVTLPDNCPRVYVSYRDCCRNGAITTMLIPEIEDYYIAAMINTKDVDCNVSPKFTNSPTPFLCVGQEVNYNHGVTDEDGDQLVFSLVDCFDGFENPVEYQAPFSGTNPLSVDINGISIDPNTGGITFTPSVLQVGVICVLVEEFRNGVKIGEVIRDIQFTVLDCSTNTIDENILPVLSGMDGTADASGTTGDFSVDVCFGFEVCFSVVGFDMDGHLLDLSWNEGIEGASFQAFGNGTTNVSADFCWTPTIDNIGVNFFTITARDNACNINGVNTYTFTINVIDEMLDFTYVQDTVSCPGESDGSATLTINSPLASPQITWPTNPPQIGPTATGLSAGWYQVLIEDPSLLCQAVPVAVQIVEREPLGVDIDSTAFQEVSCGGYQDGTLSITVSGGATPYNIEWSNMMNGATLTGIGAGTYTVTITDNEGCTISSFYEMTEPDTITSNSFVSDFNGFGVTCIGGNDGFINVSASGGSPPYSYTWSSGQTTGNISELTSGTYTVFVQDNNACIDSLVFDLTEPTMLESSLGQIPTTCFDSKDGSIVVEEITGAVPPYSWSLDAIGFGEIMDYPLVVPNQYRGDQIIYFRDAIGCVYSDTVFVDSPDSLYINVVPADTTLALGDSIDIAFSTNSDGPLSSLTWTSNVPLDCDSCLTFNYTPLDLTEFQIEIIEEEYGCRAVGVGTVRVASDDFVYVPNVFTPNEDGFNDRFNVFANTAAVTNISYFRVFDRWGELVYENENFQPNDIEIGWDGNLGGEKMMSGVYIYTLEVDYLDNTRRFFSGDVTLIR